MTYRVRIFTLRILAGYHRVGNPDRESHAEYHGNSNHGPDHASRSFPANTGFRFGRLWRWLPFVPPFLHVEVDQSRDLSGIVIFGRIFFRCCKFLVGGGIRGVNWRWRRELALFGFAVGHGGTKSIDMFCLCLVGTRRTPRSTIWLLLSAMRKIIIGGGVECMERSMGCGGIRVA